MSTNRSRRIARDAAEHLLAGASGDTRSGRGDLADLLAAAAAPATEREWVGEQAALAAFREAARLTPVPSEPRRRMMAGCAARRFPASARFLSAKAAAAALAVTALGGVAVAAGTGHLPQVLGGTPDGGPTGHAASVSGTSAAASPSAGARGRGHAAPGRSGGPGVQAPFSGQPVPPGLVPLCRLWPGDGTATADPGFEPLTRAAGGPDRVPAYCAGVLLPSDGSSDTPEAAPSSTARGNANGNGNGNAGGNGNGNGAPGSSGQPDPNHLKNTPDPGGNGQQPGSRPTDSGATPPGDRPDRSSPSPRGDDRSHPADPPATAAPQPNPSGGHGKQ